MKVQFTPLPALHKFAAHTHVITVGKGRALGVFAKEFDKKYHGALSAALKKAPRFTGAKGQRLNVVVPAGCGATGILLLGLGAVESLTGFTAYGIGAQAYAAVAANAEAALTLILDAPKAYHFDGDIAAGAAAGLQLKSYRFDKYKTRLKTEDKRTHSRAVIASPFAAQATKAFRRHMGVVQGMNIARDMGNEPANVMTPARAAGIARGLTKHGVKVEVFDAKKIHALGMGALAAVAQGSENPPRVVVMHYNGTGKKTGAANPPLALVGKGVTFDTGGINVKPFAGMWDMKFDMQGAAAVIGTLHALAMRKAKVNVVGIVGFAENMLSSNAYRPGDILTSLSGQTIEVQNTDAEGRLVMCDLIWYVQDRFQPSAVIDLATLTGACVVALGMEYAGMFSNNDDLAKNLYRAGQNSGDRLWRLPLDPAYDQQLNSEPADMRNIGNPGEAGAITAAQFLQRFVQDDTPWAHLDIAGTAFTSRDHALGPRGATGFGVRLLDELIGASYEKSLKKSG